MKKQKKEYSIFVKWLLIFTLSFFGFWFLLTYKQSILELAIKGNLMIDAEIFDTYINELTELISFIETIVILHVVAMILLVSKVIIDLSSRLEKSEELLEAMFMDVATGVHNRIKCDQILEEPDDVPNRKERIIIVLGLNNLIETNALFGHHIGDELIETFAGKLKKSKELLPYETFLGRYTGDKFIVYFSSADINALELYLEELNYLTDRFNTTKDRQFKLSFTVGYIITTERSRELTNRELFEIADNNMKLNKIAIDTLITHDKE